MRMLIYTNYKTGDRNELIYKQIYFLMVLSGVLHSVVNSVLAMYSFFEVFHISSNYLVLVFS
jgi:formate hydrogenlyase subunit 3/multisubunit Na+/H+ antiporter MnhD subunit